MFCSSSQIVAIVLQFFIGPPKQLGKEVSSLAAQQKHAIVAQYNLLKTRNSSLTKSLKNCAKKPSELFKNMKRLKNKMTSCITLYRHVQSCSRGQTVVASR